MDISHSNKEAKLILSKLYELMFCDVNKLCIKLPNKYFNENIATDLFIPLYIKLNPSNNILYVTESIPLAFHDMRTVLERFNIFKNTILQDTELFLPEKSNYLKTDKNGICMFTANGSAVCGFGCDLLAINHFSRSDHIINKEYDQEEYLNKLCRLNNEKSKVLILMHESEVFDIINFASNYNPKDKFNILDLTKVN